ncbi:MAG: MerR family transcriptional regulator [Oscillospiraceae bacterium]
MARTQELFSIGDVAQLFHLSVSSLRHYETIGLLTPEYTDPATGYRYYGPRQFEVLNTIRYLRALDMPLGQIRTFLRNRDVGRIEQLLREQKAAVVRKQAELQRVERKIDNRLRQLHDAQTAELGAIRPCAAPRAALCGCPARSSCTAFSTWSRPSACSSARRRRPWCSSARWAWASRPSGSRPGSSRRMTARFSCSTTRTPLTAT